jgi:hypothetical protein
MSSLSRKLAARGAACGLALAALATDASASVVTYTDFGAFQAAASTLTTESFEAGPWSPVGVKPQGTSNLGVTWTAENDIFAFGAAGHSGAYVITSLDPARGDFFDWIQAALPSGTNAVGGWITTFNQGHGAALQAFDALDNLLGSVSLGNTGNSYAFLGLTADTAIAKVRFLSTNVVNLIGDDIALDDFSFGSGRLSGPIAVSEPAGLALFGAALAGLAFTRRRKPRAEKSGSAALDSRLLADIGISRCDALAVAHGIDVDRLKRA